MTNRRPDNRPSSRPAGRRPVDDIEDPDSLDRAPSNVVRTDGQDYPEDAPTVAVRDLRSLGIDPEDFARTPPSRARRPSPRSGTPAAPRSREPSRSYRTPAPSQRARVPHPSSEARSSTPPTWNETEEQFPVMVVIVAGVVPVLAAAGTAAWLLWG